MKITEIGKLKIGEEVYDGFDRLGVVIKNRNGLFEAEGLDSNPNNRWSHFVDVLAFPNSSRTIFKVSEPLTAISFRLNSIWTQAETLLKADFGYLLDRREGGLYRDISDQWVACGDLVESGEVQEAEKRSLKYEAHFNTILGEITQIDSDGTAEQRRHTRAVDDINKRKLKAVKNTGIAPRVRVLAGCDF